MANTEDALPSAGERFDRFFVAFIRRIGLGLLPVFIFYLLCAIFTGTIRLAAYKQPPLLLATLANIVVGFFVGTLPQDAAPRRARKKRNGAQMTDTTKHEAPSPDNPLQNVPSPPDEAKQDAPPTPDKPQRRELDKFYAVLVCTGVLLPCFATVMTIILFISGPAGSARWAMLWGMELPVWACIVIALVCRGHATPENAVPSSYAELMQRRARLDAELCVAAKIEVKDLDSPKTQPLALSEGSVAFMEAFEQRKRINEELGTSGIYWLSARGYVSVWDKQYRAEEALIELMSKEAAVGGVAYDKLRLQNSKIPNCVGLNEMLTDAMQKLLNDEGGAKGKSTGGKGAAEDKAAGGTGGVEEKTQGGGGGANGMPPGGDDNVEEREARKKLREVRHAINEYRGGRWNGLAVARNRLLGTLFLTGLVMYMLLVVALFVLGSANINEIIIASVIFLIGAVIGLLNRLRVESQSDSALEDYGLSAARLITTPILSGVTAVFGVALFEIMPIQGISDHKTLAQIFTIEDNLSVLFIAAVFGLAPGLLFDRLQSSVDKYKAELKSSQPAEAS